MSSKVTGMKSAVGIVRVTRSVTFVKVISFGKRLFKKKWPEQGK